MTTSICFLSACNWNSAHLWENVFSDAEAALGAQMTHLDHRDPIRRRVQPGTIAEQGRFACTFRPNDGNLDLFGRFRSLDIEFSIHYKEKKREWPQVFFWTVPCSFHSFQCIVELFRLGIARLSPFYAYADTSSWVAGRSRADRRSIDPRCELRGVAWLTYFSPQYREFFGDAKFRSLSCATFDRGQGVTLQLGSKPQDVNLAEKLRIQEFLGTNSFVDPTSLEVKPVGKYVLTYEALREACPAGLGWPESCQEAPPQGTAITQVQKISLKLTVEGIKPIKNPSEVRINSFVDRMTPHGGPGFIILEGRGADYVQAAGGEGRFTVEWRKYEGDSYIHWRAGLKGRASRGKQEIITNGCKLDINGNECLTADDVKVIVNAYRQGQHRPAQYAWRDITGEIT